LRSACEGLLEWVVSAVAAENPPAQPGDPASAEGIGECSPSAVEVVLADFKVLFTERLDREPLA